MRKQESNPARRVQPFEATLRRDPARLVSVVLGGLEKTPNGQCGFVERLPAALREEAHQLRIDPVGVRPEHAMRPAGKLQELGVLDRLDLPPRSSIHLL